MTKETEITFMDLAADFDSMRPSALWILLYHYGMLEDLICLVEELYHDTFHCVRVNGSIADAFQ